MRIYNTVSFNRDDNHFKGFSSPTNIYPGPATHTALYLGIERNLITMSPREDKSQRILRAAVVVTLLGWHFDHVPDPSGPCRGPSHLHSWEKLPPQRQAVWGGGVARNTPGDEGAWLFLSEDKGNGPPMHGTLLHAVSGPLPSFQSYYFIPSSKQPCW